MDGQNTTKAILPGHRDQEPNTMTGDTETTAAHLNVVYQHPVKGEEQVWFQLAGMRKPRITNMLNVCSSLNERFFQFLNRL